MMRHARQFFLSRLAHDARLLQCRVRRSLAMILAVAALAGSVPVCADPSELVLGVFPRRSPSETIESFMPLANYLTRQLGVPVRIETTPDFNSFWDAVQTRRYDIVHYNQYHYLRSHKQLGYQVVAKNEEGGTSTIAGIVLVRTDSGFKSLNDLRGKTILFGGNKQALMSYVIPTYLLRQAGLKAGDYQEEFAPNPPNVTLAVFFRHAPAGGTGDAVYSTEFIREKVDVSKLEMLARSKPVAHLPWAVRGDLPPALRDRIRRALLAVKQAPDADRILKAASLTNIVKADDAEYNYLRHIVKVVMGEQY